MSRNNEEKNLSEQSKEEEKLASEKVNEDLKKQMDAKDKELEKLKEYLKEAKEDKTKTNTAKTVGSDELPKALTEDKTIVTKYTTLKTVIEEKLAQLEDLATMELLLPVTIRMQNRLKSIKDLGSAFHIKVRGHFKTRPPKMHISNLEGRKITNDEAVVTFGVYEVDEKTGEKKEFKNYSYEEKNGEMVKKHLSSEYRVKFEVTETIRTKKVITRETMLVEERQVITNE